MSEPIYNISDFPDAKKDPKMWEIIKAPSFQQVVSLLIFNEIRKFDPAVLNDQQTRTQLGRLKAYQELLDFPDAIMKMDDKSDDISDDPFKK